MILSKSNELYNHFSHYFASSFHKCTATSPWSTVGFKPCQAHHSRPIKFPNLSGLRGEQGTGTACWGWLCWGLVAQGGHRKPQHSSEPLLLSPYCAQHCAAGGRGGWRLMPNLCPSCSSTPELLLGLRPDRLPGYSPPAQQPHGHSADSGKKLKMKAGVIEVNWGSKTGRSIVPISLQAAVRACGESRDSGSRSSTHS